MDRYFQPLNPTGAGLTWDHPDTILLEMESASELPQHAANRLTAAPTLPILTYTQASGLGSVANPNLLALSQKIAQIFVSLNAGNPASLSVYVNSGSQLTTATLVGKGDTGYASVTKTMTTTAAENQQPALFSGSKSHASLFSAVTPGNYKLTVADDQNRVRVVEFSVTATAPVARLFGDADPTVRTLSTKLTQLYLYRNDANSLSLYASGSGVMRASLVGRGTTSFAEVSKTMTSNLVENVQAALFSGSKGFGSLFIVPNGSYTVTISDDAGGSRQYDIDLTADAPRLLQYGDPDQAGGGGGSDPTARETSATLDGYLGVEPELTGLFVLGYAGDLNLFNPGFDLLPDGRVRLKNLSTHQAPQGYFLAWQVDDGDYLTDLALSPPRERGRTVHARQYEIRNGTPRTFWVDEENHATYPVEIMATVY